MDPMSNQMIMSSLAREYARTLHESTYKAFLSWCRHPRSRALDRLLDELGNYIKSDKASQAALLALHSYRNHAISYNCAHEAVVRAMVIPELLKA